jgi:hypothetical protein
MIASIHVGNTLGHLLGNTETRTAYKKGEVLTVIASSKAEWSQLHIQMSGSLTLVPLNCFMQATL